MKKEKILEMSRSENKNGDELELYTKLKASRFANFISLWVAIAFGAVAYWLENEQAMYIVIAMYGSMAASLFFSMYWQAKRKWDLCFGILELAILIGAVVRLVLTVI